MKYFVCLTLLVLLSFGCVTSKQVKAFDGYKGRPKVVESKTYSILKTQGGIIEKAAFGFVWKFDRSGRKISDLNYGADDTVALGRWEYVYDKAGNVLQNTRYNAKGGFDVRNTYRFNRYGQEVFREYNSGAQRTITTTTYDRKRRTAVIEGYTNDTVFHEKSIVAYDYQWRETEIKSFNKNGQLQRRIEKFYDLKGNNHLSKWYDAGNRLYEFYTTAFNDRNDRISVLHYRVKSQDTTLAGTTTWEYEYDQMGNITYEALLANDVKTWVTRNRFWY